MDEVLCDGERLVHATGHVPEQVIHALDLPGRQPGGPGQLLGHRGQICDERFDFLFQLPRHLVHAPGDPHACDETREYLGQKAREGRDKARDAVEQGKEFYQRNRETVATAIERGRDAFQQARERGEQA
jgi:hypothetical protein